MSEWQPIETAPRDGTKIDVWVKKFEIGAAGVLTVSDVGRATDVEWGQPRCLSGGVFRDTGEEGWIQDCRWSASDRVALDDNDNRVTHWMPLPAAPVARLSEEAPGQDD